MCWGVERGISFQGWEWLGKVACTLVGVGDEYWQLFGVEELLRVEAVDCKLVEVLDCKLLGVKEEAIDCKLRGVEVGEVDCKLLEIDKIGCKLRWVEMDKVDCKLLALEMYEGQGEGDCRLVGMEFKFPSV